MIGTVNVLVISEDTDVCDLFHSSLESLGYNAMCVSSPLEALQLLQRGLTASLLLIHPTKNNSQDSLFAASLLQNINRDKVCILSEVGDTSWITHAAKWNISTVLTMPLMRRDIEQLVARFQIDTIAPAG